MNIKKFNESRYLIAVKKLEDKKGSVFILKELYSKYFKIETQTVEALEQHLRTLSGFSNCTLAADTLDLKKEYNLVLELSEEINLEDYNSKGDIRANVLKALKEQFTEYYTPEEVERLEAINKVVTAVNSIDKIDAQAIQYHLLTNQFIYREDVANTQKQFLRRKI